MVINEKVKYEKMPCDINTAIAKISALSSAKIDKC